MFSEKTHNKISYIAILLIAFTIPLYKKAVPYPIAVLVLNWLLEGRLKEKFQRAINHPQHKIFFVFIAYYLVYLIGLIYTEDLDFGWKLAGRKISLFIFPLFFLTFNNSILNKKNIHNFFRIFLLGCVISIVFNLFDSLYVFLYKNDNPYEFFYTNLACRLGFHPSYLSMYYVLGIAIIVNILIENFYSFTNKRKIAYALLGFFFAINILMLASKAGIITLFGLLFITFLYLVFWKKTYIKFSFSLIGLGIILIVLIKILPYSNRRFVEASDVIKKNVPEHVNNTKQTKSVSTTSRVDVWISVSQLIKEKPLFGLGTGDVSSELQKFYKKHGFITEFEKNLNTHNQYFETTLAIGLFGLFLLLLGMLMTIVYSVRAKHFLLFTFFAIISLNFMVESMLERQEGVVFYAFFSSFFLGILYKPSIFGNKATDEGQLLQE